jgi:predicted solute-binding protein
MDIAAKPTRSPLIFARILYEAKTIISKLALFAMPFTLKQEIAKETCNQRAHRREFLPVLFDL